MGGVCGRSRLTGAAAIAALVVGAAAGCVPSRQEPGQAAAAVDSALERAHSAVATTTLTVTLLDEDRLLAATADAAVLDQIRELEDATTALTTLVPPDDATSATRSEALDTVAGATGAVVTARAWVAAESGGDLTPAGDVPADPAELIEELTTAADGLAAVLTQDAG